MKQNITAHLRPLCLHFKTRVSSQQALYLSARDGSSRRNCLEYLLLSWPLKRALIEDLYTVIWKKWVKCVSSFSFSSLKMFSALLRYKAPTSLFRFLSFDFPGPSVRAAVCVTLSMLSVLKALLWHLTAEHYCFCGVHWHLYILKNVCENDEIYLCSAENIGELRGYHICDTVWQAYFWDIKLQRLSHSSWDESRSNGLLVLSDMWIKTICFFAKVLTCHSIDFKIPLILKWLFQNQCKVIMYSKGM